ncbi:MAG TPA: class I SAM-dependent methyltransferase [Acidimicrobiales bacterium]|nr:class I SAM-dependent methyltransferase [Acidimicrobiales bacterium]
MEDFDAAAVFNEDFNYFYAERVGGARSDEEFSLLEGVAGPFPGRLVLDCCCGEGRIASRLHAAGARVVGLDRSPAYLAATRAAGCAAVVAGDARALPFRGAFDLVVCWYTSFGYFDDETNRAALSEMRRALRPGGRLVIDLDARAHLLRSGLPTQVRERGDDLMVEQFRYDAPASRVRAMRTVVRSGEVRRSDYFVRLFGEEELAAWLADGGFEAIELCDERGGAFTEGARRMVVSARRPLRAR